MGLSQLEICNQALLKVGADVIDTLTPPASTEDGTKRSIELCNIFFDQAYEEVLRIYPWNSAKKRTVLNLSETAVYPPITVSVTGFSFEDTPCEFTNVSDDRPNYSAVEPSTTLDIYYKDGNWTLVFTSSSVVIDLWEVASTNNLPPKTGWGVGTILSSAAPTLAYDQQVFGYDYMEDLPSDLIRLIDIFRYEDQRDERTAWVVEGGYVLSDYDVLYLKYIAKPSTEVLDPLCTNAVICMLAMKLCTALQLDDAWAKRINDELYGIILPQARSIDTLENKELLLEESSWVLSRDYNYPTI